MSTNQKPEGVLRLELLALDVERKGLDVEITRQKMEEIKRKPSRGAYIGFGACVGLALGVLFSSALQLF